ncbi:MAG: hypothetical protein C4527_22160 [Candidatus Omnitrophota bacterium]|jgi:hypothetical protein|nr:MAG: hypothetical protein C4527_22160 [Candidatus Omnitrophota bacterium]
MIRLSESQKYSIICILRDLAALDRNFGLLEAVRIRLIGLKMDLHQNKIEEAMCEDFEDLNGIKKRLDEFPDGVQRRFLYQQCLLLVMADRDLGEMEKQAIEEIRKSLGIRDDMHEKIVQWVLDGMNWEKHGEELIGGVVE